jgi:hypothetical protein
LGRNPVSSLTLSRGRIEEKNRNQKRVILCGLIRVFKELWSTRSRGCSYLRALFFPLSACPDTHLLQILMSTFQRHWLL